MSKRGQVFILSAIIIVFLIYSTVYTYNTLNVHSGLEDFEKNVNQYEKESILVVNDAIYQGKSGDQQAEELKKWASIFKEGVKSSDPNFGSISIYKDTDGNVHIINTLTNKSITIEYLSKDASAENTKLGFFSKEVPPKGTDTEGKICSKTEFGQICTTVNTDVSNFGKSFDYAQSIEDVDLAYLCIKIENLKLSSYPLHCPEGTFEITLSGFQSYSTSSAQTSEQTVQDKEKTGEIVKVSYPK
jgi:hypothetical protein